MALRLVQIIVPKQRKAEVLEVVGAARKLDSWSEDLGDGRARVSLLLDATESETILDQVADRMEIGEGLRAILLPVEGTVPRAQQDSGDPAQSPESEPSKTRFGSSRISRTELLEDLDDGLEVRSTFLIFVVLSSIVGAVGLLRDNSAVIIGAMVIAPLLTPNMALALSTTLGDLDMMRRALITNGAGVLTAFAFACGLGWWLPIGAESEAVLSRTVVSTSDVILALASGTAGALAFTTGVPAGLVGVMVAVALLPPTVVAGLTTASGELHLARGAILLLGVNVICVNLAAVLTFWIQGVRPRRWWETEKAKRATRTAALLWATALLVLMLLMSSL